MMRKNYHTHTYRCKHAEGDVADYCRVAMRKGLRVLGISDHAPLPDNRWPDVRMGMEELPAYCRAIDDARKSFPGLVVLKGMECEYDKDYAAFYREELLGRLEFDYLIGSVHYFPYKGEWLNVHRGFPANDIAALRSYARHFILTMESGLFDFMAHPDLFAKVWLAWDADAAACSRDMLEAAASLDMPLEINCEGLRRDPILAPEGLRPPYPTEPFWELTAEYHIRVLVGSDAHHPEDIMRNTEAAEAIARKYGLAFADMSGLEERGAENACGKGFC